MFSTLRKTNLIFSVTFILSSANAFKLDRSKILSFGKGLIMGIKVIMLQQNINQKNCIVYHFI